MNMAFYNILLEIKKAFDILRQMMCVLQKLLEVTNKIESWLKTCQANSENSINNVPVASHTPVFTISIGKVGDTLYTLVNHYENTPIQIYWKFYN